jgi:hypothetical protein
VRAADGSRRNRDGKSESWDDRKKKEPGSHMRASLRPASEKPRRRHPDYTLLDFALAETRQADFDAVKSFLQSHNANHVADIGNERHIRIGGSHVVDAVPV